MIRALPHPLNDRNFGTLFMDLLNARRRAEMDHYLPPGWFGDNWTLYFAPVAWDNLHRLTSGLAADHWGTVRVELVNYERPGPLLEPIVHRETVSITRVREEVHPVDYRLISRCNVYGIEGYCDDKMRPLESWRVADRQGFTVLTGVWE